MRACVNGGLFSLGRVWAAGDGQVYASLQKKASPGGANSIR